MTNSKNIPKKEEEIVEVEETETKEVKKEEPIRVEKPRVIVDMAKQI